MNDISNFLPKVLIVDLSMDYGGSSSRVLSLMTKAPPGKIALAGLRSSAITQQAKQLNLPVHILGQHKVDPHILSHLMHLIRTQGYLILDTQNIQSKFWASIAAKLTNTTLVSTINSWYANEHGHSSIKGKIYTALELSTNWGLSLYITVSEKDRQALLRSKITEDAIELIHNAVEVDPAKILGSPDWLCNKFDLPFQSLVCVAVGRLVQVKGYDILIDAAQRIVSKVSEFICIIVGEGECKEALRRQIQRAGLENQIRLVGFQNRETVLSILKSSDIFVMPSRYEGTPIALLEAAALGCPILASSCGGIPELVTNDVHALLVQPNDSIALAEGLLRLSTDRKYAHSLGQNAQQKVQKDFNIHAQVRNTWNAYQKARSRHNKQA
ncbi:MAG: glycosyltransferase family 4 protein [Anaerolineales bacterium]|nr:glycosyltransferase family 4 protein [Anaerolineales bacterium]